MKKIKILLADDNDNTRSSVRQLLELDPIMDVVAEARTGKEVIENIKRSEPEIVIMDINMPEIDGIEATKEITMYYPGVAVVIISVSDEINNFRKAMMAGAKEYLVKPLSPDELNTTVRKVVELNRKQYKKNSDSEVSSIQQSIEQQENKIITVFGTKGGVGKSVLSTNLAVAMAQQKKTVGLVDLDIQFGDVSIMMDLNPKRTISELMQEGDEITKDLLEDYIYERHKVHILPAPNRPELAELVSSYGVKRVLTLYRMMYNYTFVDTPSFIDEITLNALEVSDVILLVMSLDLPTIKNVKKGIDILKSLQFLPKTKLILNRSTGIAGIEPRDVERVLDMKIKAEVPSDGKLVVSSLNQGIPFVKLNPKAPVSKAIQNVIKVI